MATTNLISAEEYLKTSYDPDCEFIHGNLEKRPVPEWDHAAWQEALIGWFRDHKIDWNIRVFPELRVQVAADHFRIPDVTILSRNAPREQIITHPPLAVFEILSPDDSMTAILDKLEAYDSMGIPAIWVIDPRKPAFLRYSGGQLTPTPVFDLPGTSFTVPIGEIAAQVE